jgi:hypothetical protein
MTVAELCARMSNLEFVKWGVYYQRQQQREERAIKKARKRR